MNFQTSQLTRMFGDRVIFENINIQIQGRERIGLVGPNGAGKSTLLQVLAGVQRADRGQIQMTAGVRLGYLPQQVHMEASHDVESEMRLVIEPVLALERQIREAERQMSDPNVAADELRWKRIADQYDQLNKQFQDAGGYASDAKLRSVLSGMGFPQSQWQQPVNTLSGGQKTRLGLAKLLLQKPDILLLDEPTNHLDLDTLAWLETYLAGFDGAIVAVSHDRFFLDQTAQTIWELENGKMKTYKGNYTRYMATRKAEKELAGVAFARQQEQIAKLEDFIQRNIARASTSKRAKSRRNQLEALDRLEAPDDDPSKMNIHFHDIVRSGKDVLKVDQLRLISQDISFELKRGESVALIGANGTGKTTLMRKLLEAFDAKDSSGYAEHGAVRWGASLVPGYYDQEMRGLNPDQTILETVWSAFPHLEEKEIRSALGRMQFSGESVRRTIKGLSGGEKARVVWCLLFLTKPNVMLLDEPTNHLDLWTREALEDALVDYEGTMLVISHDRYFLNKTGERIFQLDQQHLTIYEGNYDDWTTSVRSGSMAGSGTSAALPTFTPATVTETVNTVPTGHPKQDHRENQREMRQQKRKLEQLEQQIAGLESRISELEQQMADESMAQDYDKWQKADKEKQALQAELEPVFLAWTELAEQMEN